MRHKAASPTSTRYNRDALHTITVGQRSMLVKGMSSGGLQDLYFLSMTCTWPHFYGSVAALFALLNTVFATLYQLMPGSIANQAPEGFWGAFFFSVETLATVGYGDMHPATLYAHALATLEIFIGMMSIALITGLTFARFSRPRSRVMASRYPVISNYNGKPALMLRAVNARKSMIVQASANLYLLIRQQSQEGMRLRRLLDMQLVRDVHPMFMLSWTLIHPIDESSPLWGHDAQSLADHGADIVLTISGSDEVTTQDMRSRHVYSHQDIRWNHAFEDMLHTDEHGREQIDLERLHHTRPL